MRLDEAEDLARSLLRQNGLTRWNVVFDNARVRAGVCRPWCREIGLSRVLTQLHTRDEVKDTILHEIAHALVGTKHGHNEVWQAAARAIGCSATRCLPPTAARADSPWVGRCPRGHLVPRYRRPVRVQSCRMCSPTFDPTALLQWSHRDGEIPMDARYLAELQRVAPEVFASIDRHSHAKIGPTAAGFPSATAAQPQAARSRATQAHSPRDHHPRQVGPAATGVSPGDHVRIESSGKYHGVEGLVIKKARTRYHLTTARGVLTVPFDQVSLVQSASASR